MIGHPACRSSRGRSARPARPRASWPRASRSSPCPTGTSACAATSTRASPRPPRHLPQLGLRAAPAALRRGRLRLSRVGPDGHQRHQRQAPPAARRRRAVRRALRRRCRAPRADARPAGRAASTATVHWTSPAGQADRACGRPGWCRSPSGRSPPSATRSRPSTTRPRIVVQSELVANEPHAAARADDPRVAAALESPLRRRGALGAPGDRRASCVHRAATAACGWRRPWSHCVEGPRAHRGGPATPTPDIGRFTVTTVLQPGRDAAHREVPRLRLVGRSAPARRCATRSTPPSTAARHTGWDGPASQEQRRYLDDFWARADVEIERRRRDPAGGPLRALPRAPGRRPGRAPGHPGQGPDRHRLRRPRLLGHRDVRAAGAHLHAPRGGGRRPALAPLDPARRPASGRRDLGLAGAAFPWRTIDGRRVLGLLAGRHRRLPRQRRHRRRRRPLRRRHRATRHFERAGRRRAAGRDGPAVALPRPPRPRRRGSASTG